MKPVPYNESWMLEQCREYLQVHPYAENVRLFNRVHDCVVIIGSMYHVIELKRHDWVRAFEQLSMARMATDRLWVMMPHDYITDRCKCDADKHGIGIIAFYPDGHPTAISRYFRVLIRPRRKSDLNSFSTIALKVGFNNAVKCANGILTDRRVLRLTTPPRRWDGNQEKLGV